MNANDVVEFGERTEASEFPKPPVFQASQDELSRLIDHREYMERLKGFCEELEKEAKQKEKKLIADVDEAWSLSCKQSEKRAGYTYTLGMKVHPSVVGGTPQAVGLFKLAGLEGAIEVKETLHASRVKSILNEMISETEDGELDLSGIPDPLRGSVKVYREVVVSKRKATR